MRVRAKKNRTDSRTGFGGGQNRVDYRRLVTKEEKSSHVTVLLHTRQNGGLLVKEIGRQPELPLGKYGNSKSDLKPFREVSFVLFVLTLS